LPKEIAVSDNNPGVLKKLEGKFPELQIFQNDNTQPASRDIVFVALHPPAIKDAIGSVKSSLKANAVLISLAPRISIRSLTEITGGFQRIVRMIPNAPSIISAGYNPVAFSINFTKEEKEALIDLFSALGKCPEVAEDLLETYAIITAMGPTYLWFQLNELQTLAESFGMTSKEAKKGIAEMVNGSLKTLYESGLSPDEIMDLIPVKPLGEEEANIRNIYRIKLRGLYSKLKG
jgi:pyrroline-5-carboxylate reductase